MIQIEKEIEILGVPEGYCESALRRCDIDLGCILLLPFVLSHMHKNWVEEIKLQTLDTVYTFSFIFSAFF